MWAITEMHQFYINFDSMDWNRLLIDKMMVGARDQEDNYMPLKEVEIDDNIQKTVYYGQIKTGPYEDCLL